VAAERVAAVAEEVVPHAAGVAEAAAPALLQAGVAEAAAEAPALLQAGVAEVAAAELASQRVAVEVEVPALPGRQPAVRPSAVVPSCPSRLRSAPVQRPAVTRLAVHAPLRSQIALPTVRWWRAARGEVWSW
jgi:hypothetical protein